LKFILKGYGIDCAKRKCEVETTYSDAKSQPVKSFRLWVSIEYRAMSGFVPVPNTVWGDITMAVDQQN
jgi:hypothetical protein